MKFKNSFGSQLLAGIALIFLFAILIPFGLFFLIFRLITMPYNYYKHRHSPYQKDFPHKFNFLDPFHVDDLPYSTIKKHELPVRYVKQSDVYDAHGYFMYKDILLDFTEPFFFDSETNSFVFVSEEEVPEDAENDSSTAPNDSSVEEATALLLRELHCKVPQCECKRIVFLYSQERLKKAHGENAVKAMKELNDFIVYEKNALHQALKEFTDTH